ncbi:MAG: endonuclease MutS2 [Clostridiales bacterium]|jgi:DNA mismatch repair protein MutS2|nr:endonuclease MutS2 [Clostridiales bacterium]
MLSLDNGKIESNFPSKIEFKDANSNVYCEHSSFEILQFETLLQQVALRCVSQPGQKLVLNLQPCTDIEQVKQQLDAVSEAIFVLQLNLHPLKKFEDIKAYLQKCSLGSVACVSELIEVAQVLSVANSASKTIESLESIKNLQGIFTHVEDLTELKEHILSALDGQQLKDSASDKLQKIRSELKYVKNELLQKLQRLMNGSCAKYLQDSIVTIRNDRFVLPIKAEFKTSVQGLLHDQSDSLSTVFIEPYEIVKENNALIQLKVQEGIEIDFILRQLSRLVAKDVKQIERAFGACVQLDCVFAKAQYAMDTNSTRPNLNTFGIIELQKARHPLLDSKTVVPIDIKVGGKTSILLISGPNTGGKTVALKLLGLFSLMSSCGIFLPCEKESTISIFDYVFCIIGDGQSIEQSLSSFSAYIKKVKFILQSASNKSLVLLDELGTGTDPQEGAALALGIIKYINNLQCTTVITTHFNQLKEYATANQSISNASFEFDQSTLKPTYRLAMDLPGTSFALNIASRLGLPQQVIQDAFKNLSQESIKFNQLLSNMHVKAASMDRQLQEIEIKNSQIDSKLVEIERQKQVWTKKNEQIVSKADSIKEQLVQDCKHQIKLVIQQLNQIKDISDEKALFEARKLNSRVDSLLAKPSKKSDLTVSQIKEGDQVLVTDLNTVGTVKEIKRKNKILVSFGTSTINCDITNLQLIDDKNVKRKENKKESNSQVAKRDTQIAQQQVELMLIGCTVDESKVAIQSFFSQCIFNNQRYVKIVHGKGSGVLGRGVHQYLKQNRQVKSFRYGFLNEGDVGVTIVELN